MTEPFHRTNINLYAIDVDWLRSAFGYGWTEKVREVIHDYVNELKEPPIPVRGPRHIITHEEWRKLYAGKSR